MTAAGWFLAGILTGIFLALYQEPEPGVEVGEVQASWTGSDGPGWAFA